MIMMRETFRSHYQLSLRMGNYRTSNENLDKPEMQTTFLISLPLGSSSMRLFSAHLLPAVRYTCTCLE